MHYVSAEMPQTESRSDHVHVHIYGAHGEKKLVEIADGKVE